MEPTDDDFLASINVPGLANKYRLRLNEGSKKIRAQFRKNKKTIKSQLQHEIANYEEHDELVNMIIFPFVQNTVFTTMGYRLVWCDPLYEKKLPNFDVMISKIKETSILSIFIEAKTSDRHLHGLVDELIEKQRICEENQDYICEKYLDSKLPNEFEYVVCGYSLFIDNIQDAIEQKFSNAGSDSELVSRKLIVWKADKWKSILGLANPGKSNTFQRAMLHNDTNLSTELSRGVVVSHKALSFFPQSHIVTKLKSLTKMIISIKAYSGKSEFRINDVKDYLANELYYLTNKIRDEIMKKILDMAVKIGIIYSSGFDTYNVSKEYSGSSLREQIVEKLWIEYRIKEQQTQQIDEFSGSLRTEIKSEIEKTDRLDNYMNNRDK